jgi:hypothetical protein
VRDPVVPAQHVRSFLIDNRLISAPDLPHAETDIAIVETAQPARTEKTFRVEKTLVRKISTGLAPIALRSAA